MAGNFLKRKCMERLDIIVRGCIVLLYEGKVPSRKRKGRPMMIATENDKSKPFHVRTTTGSFCKGFDSLDSATANAAKRDDAAKTLGIAARYVAAPAPGK